jgi:hypothetical protein
MEVRICLVALCFLIFHCSTAYSQAPKGHVYAALELPDDFGDRVWQPPASRCDVP